MSTPSHASSTFPPADGTDPLRDLVSRIAEGDRAAFRCLYAFLATQVWREAFRLLPTPSDARAVTRSTFVEMWHLAQRRAADPDLAVRAWITAITTRHVAERLRTRDLPGDLRADTDRRIHLELAALLGAGPAMIRTGPAAFVRVSGLDPVS